MNRHRLTRLVPVAALALVAGACDEGWTDLTGLNDDPNSPTSVAAPFVFTEGVQEATDEILGNGLNMDYGEHLAQHLAEIAYPEEDVYQYRSVEINTRFREAYAEYLKEFQNVIDQGRANEEPNVEAAGLIMKSWVFQNLTDIWGDLPYSQALMGDSIITPAYDTQQEIYAGMLADLTAAGQMIDAGSDPFGAQDLIYQGDMGAWQKFANSLRLRLALRLSEVDPATARSEFTAALNAPGGVFTSNADNANICYGSVTRHPWWSYFDGSRANDYRMSATLIDTLKSLDDPRLGIYAQPIESATVEGTPVEAPFYRGMPSGRLDGHGYAPAETSKPGEAILDMDGCLPLMTYAEVLFARAEAAARGWTSEDAAQLYADAIRASMEQWGVEDAAIEAYLAQPRIQFNQATWRQQIGLQKWLALFGQGMEAYAEVRRLNYPQLTPGADAVLDQLPARYPYGFSEETFNKANLFEAVQRQGMANPSDQTTPVWWDAS